MMLIAKLMLKSCVYVYTSEPLVTVTLADLLTGHGIANMSYGASFK